MENKNTLEEFLGDALKDGDIEYRVVISAKESKRVFYLISNEKGSKKRVVGFQVEGNNVKPII